MICPQLHFMLAVLLFTTASSEASQSSSRESKPSSPLHEKVGDDTGRPLYNFRSVSLPDKAFLEEMGSTGPACLLLGMDSANNALDVSPMVYKQGIEVDGGGNVAAACFQDAINTTGWNSLQVKTTTNEAVPLSVRAYGAGMVEGLLTYDQIRNFNRTVGLLLEKDVNSIEKIGGGLLRKRWGGYPRGARSYMNSIENSGGGAMAAVERVLRMSLISWDELSGGDAATEPKEDVPRQAWALLLQMRGIRDGYNMIATKRKTPTLSMFHLMVMNMHAELPAVVDLYGRSEQAKVFASLLQTSRHTRRVSTKQQHSEADGSEDEEALESDRLRNGRGVAWARWASHMPRGSAVVRKVGADGAPEDIISGHVTFGNYGEMLRFMKTYDLNFGASVGKITMSSYPACVSSTDDYFVTDKGLVVMSTNLWLPEKGQFARPPRTNEGLASFVRAVIATRLASQPRMWAKTYGYFTGVAGAKQWLIADYSKFKRRIPVTNGTVFLVESLPRLMRMGDVSMNLRTTGFFEAHGTPHFRQTREIFGFPGQGPGAYKERRGSALTDKAVRIQSLPMARLWLSDATPARTSIGKGIEQIPITTRHDFSKRPIPEGGIDAKVTSRCLVKDLRLQAVSGPPTGGDEKPFQWAELGDEWPHFGLPHRWNFSWVDAGERGITSPVNDALAVCEDAA